MIRILIGFFVLLATMISYMLRVNLNIAIVTMTQNDSSNSSCPDYDSK